jgi:DNA adenine methylase
MNLREMRRKEKNWVKALTPYAGQKGNQLNDVYDILPDRIQNYYEPFMGMGVIGMNILRDHEYFKLETFQMSDLNENNIGLFNIIKDDPEYIKEVLIELFKPELSKEYFNEIKNDFNKNIKDKIPYYMFLMMNVQGGEYRVNKRGEFNKAVNPGSIKYNHTRFKRLDAALERIDLYNELLNIENVEIDILVRDYYDLYENVIFDQDTLIVLDPPYDGSEITYSTEVKDLNNDIVNETQQFSDILKYISFDYFNMKSIEDQFNSPIFLRLKDKNKSWNNRFTNYELKMNRWMKNIEELNEIGQTGLETMSWNF